MLTNQESTNLYNLWVHELKSNCYDQCYGALNRPTDRFCGLGLLVNAWQKIYNNLEREKTKDNEDWCFSYNGMVWTLPKIILDNLQDRNIYKIEALITYLNDRKKIKLNRLGILVEKIVHPNFILTNFGFKLVERFCLS